MGSCASVVPNYQVANSNEIHSSSNNERRKSSRKWGFFPGDRLKRVSSARVRWRKLITLQRVVNRWTGGRKIRGFKKKNSGNIDLSGDDDLTRSVNCLVVPPCWAWPREVEELEIMETVSEPCNASCPDRNPSPLTMDERIRFRLSMARWKIRGANIFRNLSRSKLYPEDVNAPQKLLRLRKSMGDITLKSNLEAKRVQSMIETELDWKFGFDLREGDIIFNNFEQLSYKAFKDTPSNVPSQLGALQRLKRVRAGSADLKMAENNRQEENSKIDKPKPPSSSSSPEEKKDSELEKLNIPIVVISTHC